MLAVGFNPRIEIGRIPRRVATAHNQEQRTKNQELPKTPALQTTGFFIIQRIPLRLGVIPYQASEPILLEFNIHYSLFNILRRSRNADPSTTGKSARMLYLY